MGGKESHEFMVAHSGGRDQIVSCDGCTTRANMEESDVEALPVDDLAA